MHDHDHAHTHGHGDASQAEALLIYMLDHNRHHAQELHDLAHQLEGEAADLVHAAVHDFEHGNEKLQRALTILKGE